MFVQRVLICALICCVASVKAAPKADGDKSSSEEEGDVRYGKFVWKRIELIFLLFTIFHQFKS